LPAEGGVLVAEMVAGGAADLGHGGWCWEGGGGEVAMGGRRFSRGRVEGGGGSVLGLCSRLQVLVKEACLAVDGEMLRLGGEEEENVSVGQLDLNHRDQ
jgi:hypothetical protein